MTQTAAQTTAIPQALRDRWASAPKAQSADTDHGQRGFRVDRAATDEAARTVTLAFASETPYDRWWGTEILECTPGAMRLGRLQTGANLLCDHDTRDVVGVVESISIGADRVGRAVVRFGKSARAEEVFQDVLGGIRQNVSVGYMIHKAVLVETLEGRETYRVTDWEPYEVSLVSVPADASVGVGRSAVAADATKGLCITVEVEIEDTNKPDSEAPDTEEAAPATPPPSDNETRKAKAMTDTTIQTPAARNHAAEISAIAATLPGGPELALKAIQAGQTVEQFQADAIRALSAKPVPTADIGMSKAEIKQFSLLRAMHAMANPTDPQARAAAAFEFECSRAVGEKMGREARGIFLPAEVQRRDLTAGTSNAGGYSVATELRGFIDILRNAMVIDRAGAVFLSGLVGNIAIPKLSGSATAYWVAENAAPTESQQTLAQVTMGPKTVGAFTDISRRLLVQSSLDVQNMVTRDLATIIGLAIQQAAINGPGSGNAPSGIMTLVTPSVVGGTNGAAPTWANIVGLETNIASSNADVGTLGYLPNAKVRGKLKVTEKFATTNGQPVWVDGATPLNGYAGNVTNAVPSNLTKGSSSVASAIIFGNFADLLIGLWGSTDILVDPYTGGAAGTVRVRVLQDCDIALRNVESFATMVDALTA